jgi:hypothetical protein
VRECSDREHPDTLAAEECPDEGGCGARPAQRSIQGEHVDDPQDEDDEVKPVLHRACHRCSPSNRSPAGRRRSSPWSARGRTNSEIGNDLHISVSTVKTHLAGLMRKLSARNRVELAMWAYGTNG